MRRHVVLIGLPGAGKSTVGAAVAARLGARFMDGDVIVESRVGKPVTRIFAEDGEAVFRGHERRAVADALAGTPAVIAPGGGWAAQPGNLDAARNALTIHLEVTTGEAVRRTAGATRPLFAGDPAGTLERLATERLPLYRQATVTVQTDHRSVAEVTDLVVQLARSEGGW